MENPDFSPEAETEKASKPSRAKVLILVLVVLLAALGGAYYYFFYQPESEEPPTVAINDPSTFQGLIQKQEKFATGKKYTFLSFDEKDITAYKNAQRAFEGTPTPLKLTDENKGMYYLYSDKDQTLKDVMESLDPQNGELSVVVAFWDAEENTWKMTDNSLYVALKNIVGKTLYPITKYKIGELHKAIIPAYKGFFIFADTTTEILGSYLGTTFPGSIVDSGQIDSEPIDSALRKPPPINGEAEPTEEKAESPEKEPTEEKAESSEKELESSEKEPSEQERRPSKKLSSFCDVETAGWYLFAANSKLLKNNFEKDGGTCIDSAESIWIETDWSTNEKGETLKFKKEDDLDTKLDKYLVWVKFHKVPVLEKPEEEPPAYEDGSPEKALKNLLTAVGNRDLTGINELMPEDSQNRIGEMVDICLDSLETLNVGEIAGLLADSLDLLEKIVEDDELVQKVLNLTPDDVKTDLKEDFDYENKEEIVKIALEEGAKLVRLVGEISEAKGTEGFLEKVENLINGLEKTSAAFAKKQKAVAVYYQSYFEALELLRNAEVRRAAGSEAKEGEDRVELIVTLDLSSASAPAKILFDSKKYDVPVGVYVVWMVKVEGVWVPEGTLEFVAQLKTKLESGAAEAEDFEKYKIVRAVVTKTSLVKFKGSLEAFIADREVCKTLISNLVDLYTNIIEKLLDIQSGIINFETFPVTITGSDSLGFEIEDTLLGRIHGSVVEETDEEGNVIYKYTPDQEYIGEDWILAGKEFEVALYCIDVEKAGEEFEEEEPGEVDGTEVLPAEQPVPADGEDVEVGGTEVLPAEQPAPADGENVEVDGTEILPEEQFVDM